ncbi:MAG: 3-deoxy-7-phosphoheptulonate synthase [Thiopseudomonas sp.]
MTPSHATALNLLHTASAQPAAVRLPTPSELQQRLPLSASLRQRIRNQRQSIADILQGRDPRLLVVVGPCSIHDPLAAMDYAQRLATLADELSDTLLLAMRVYTEKPRTTVGWKGLLYDPHLDGSAGMDEGLALSRRLMLQVAELGLPVATELLQPLTVPYFADLLGWAAIGARTSESQVHREMVSGLEVPTGFKNGTDGGVQIALDAMRSAAHGHQYMGLDGQGRVALLQASGNRNTHLVLRGGSAGSNYDEASVAHALQALQQAGQGDGIMVDCSHANSGKDPQRQPLVLDEVVRQRLAGNLNLRAVMIESHLCDGQQSLGGPLEYGVSVTDGCLGWSKTEAMLRRVAAQLA